VTDKKRIPLFKTTVVIWTVDDMSDIDLRALAYECENGDGHCASRKTVKVEKREADPDWDGTTFFDFYEEDFHEEEVIDGR
jgi:hypothetical protein